MALVAQELRHIIAQGEGISVEFKQALRGLPRDAFETVCAFLNRQGGYLILGVRDDGHLQGVVPELVDQLKRDFATLSNNPNKLHPPMLLELTELRLDEQLLLYVYVPQSSQVHRCDNIVYDRGHEGDFRVLSDADISQLYVRKSSFYTEGRIYPFLQMEDFKPELLPRVRTLIRNNRPNHPWLALDDMELMRQSGLWKRDYQTGQTGFTLAATLLLGRDEVIHNVLPHYRIDALVRRVDLDRYDDRIDIRTNLIDGYSQLMNFAERHLPDKFFLQQGQRRSLREFIFREVVGNLIVHREYINPTPASFIVYSDRVEVRNANKPTHYGPINPEQFAPFPKNPTIANFFGQLGRVDELGSGIRNVTIGLREYAPGQQAHFIEEDVFKTVIPIPNLSNNRSTDLALVQEAGIVLSDLDLPRAMRTRMIYALEILGKSGGQTSSQLAAQLNVTGRTIRRDMAILREHELVVLNGNAYELHEAWNQLDEGT
ncbi:RNA-binding domain-containing protein [Hymenobacter koreensis]|uniref:DNA binding domain-containing protein n=1 Tax=Hymenobacter koreensis TaxID=1084523 RepID=A0ABP8IZQ4_9BACT